MKLIMQRNKLLIALWNCRSVKSQRTAEARKKLESFRKFSRDYDIIILTETWLKPDCEFEIEGFRIIRNDRENKRGGGVAILIRDGLRYERVSEICCRDRHSQFLAIKVIGKTNDILIAGCYRPPNNPIRLQDWNDFFEQLNDSGSFVLAGDLNAHHPSWNCIQTKPDGKKLRQLITNYSFKVHNTKHQSHVGNKKYPSSNVDLVITDSDLSGCVKTHQLHDRMRSDHFPVQCAIDFAFRVLA